MGFACNLSRRQALWPSSCYPRLLRATQYTKNIGWSTCPAGGDLRQISRANPGTLRYVAMALEGTQNQHMLSVANYTDTSKWSNVVQVTSGGLVQIAQELSDEKIDSAIIYRATGGAGGGANSDVLRIDEELGSPDDAWLLLGRNRTYTHSVLAWPHAPITWRWKKQ